MAIQGISQQLLQSLTPSVFDTLQQERGQEQALTQGDQQTQLGQQKLDANTMKLAQGELNAKAQEASSLLTFSTPEELRANLIRRAQEITRNPVPGIEAEDLIDMANRLGQPNGFNTIQNELKSDLERIKDINAKITKAASPRAFAPIVDPVSGQLGVPTFDPGTNKAGFQVIEGAPMQLTPEQKRLAEIKTTQKEADIGVAATEQKEIIKQRVSRASEIRKEISTRNRDAARSGRTLRQALVLAQQASQGLAGSAKLKLSRLLPGIDSSDEAALDSTLKQLALEQLQQFKGPTTDFEFRVTESIAGALGQSRESNIARIKSLDRARFFNERESQQFNKFIKDGGDPDNFRFNFAEVIKTKKGPFTLQDIQDTAVQNNLTIEETIKRLNQ